MVKVFALIPRRQDLTEEVFHEHWRGPHAELAKRITTMRTYSQSHRAGAGVPGVADASYDGIAEVRFDDLATAAGMGDDPNYANGCHVDEPLFIDVDRLGFLLSSEGVLKAGPAVGQEDGGVKAMLLLGRADGQTPEAFADALSGLGDALLGAAPDALRVTVSTALPEMYADGAEPVFDAVLELFFDGDDTTTAGTAAARLVAVLDAAVDPSRTRAFTAEEVRVVWPEHAPAVV